MSAHLSDETTASKEQSTRILVVDDNPVVLFNVAQLLRGVGYEVLEAGTGEQCLSMVVEFKPDMVMLDVVLPDIRGTELCAQIKARPELRSTFVVLLSSTETSADQKVAGLDAGADGYIVRPIDNRELLARVQALIRIQQTETALHRAHHQLEERVAQRTAELSEANAALLEEIEERRRAEDALQQQTRRLQDLSRRLLEVQETERRAIARELHDEVGQVLTGLSLTLQAKPGWDAAALAAQMREAQGMVSELLGRVRELSLNLRPQVLDDLGLMAALDWLFKRYHKQTQVRVAFRHSELNGRLAAPVETAVFRIVQEALTNVARHAGVQEATVRLWADSRHLRVQIEDEGRGFHAEQALGAGASSGLGGMRERTILLGGEFTLESEVGAGARLTVELPLEHRLDMATQRRPE